MSNRLGSTGIVLLLIGLLVFATGSSALAQQNQVIIKCPVDVTPPAVDTPIPVEVHYTIGTDPVGGFSLGFHYDSDIIEVDSLSKIGSDLQSFFFTPTLKDVVNNTILGGYADFSGVMPIPAGDSGLAFTLWFTVPGGTDAHCVDLDSAFVPPAGNFIFSLQAGGSTVPNYVDCGTEDITIGECGGAENIPPTAVCQDVTVSADANCVANVAAAAVDNGSFDTDGTIVDMSLSPAGPYSLGETVVTLTVTDDMAATNQCQATITVVDDTPPEITCPSNINVGNDAGECGAIVNFQATATDNCDGDVTITYSQDPGTFFPYGPTVVTATATDDAGNQDQCQFTVAVNDVENPVAICPGNIEVGNDAGECGAIVNFSIDATDNCPTNLTVEADPASGSMFPIGQTTVTVTARDGANNTNQCTFTVTVNDVEAPSITCPANIEVDNDAGECGAVVIFEATFDDNCAGANVVYEPANGSFFEIGTTQVTATVTDGAGLTDQCTFDVTVNDTEDPVAICPGDINVQVDEGTTEQVVEFAIDATDNCPGVIVSANPASGFSFPLGTTTVTVTAEDAAGNTNQCTFDVTLSEQLIPDYSVEVDVDTFFATEGVASNFNAVVTVTSINGWDAPITLSTSALPTGVNVGFSVNPVNPTGNSDLSGSTDETTPAGTYPISIIGSAPTKVNGHEYVVYLVVEPCAEPPIVGLSETYFEITIQEGEDAEDVELYITNDAPCGTLDWAANSDMAWAVPNPASGSVEAGTSPGDLLTIELNTADLAVGDYTAMIDVLAVSKVAAAIQVDIHVEASADTVWVAQNVIGYPGQPVTVPVTFLNNEKLAGMSIGLMWDNPILYLDSVSYVGSRVEYVTNKTVVIDNGDQTVGAGLFVIPGSEMQVPVGMGQWFNLHFTVDGGAAGGTVVDIDSMFIETNPSTGIELIFNDSLGTEIYPQFVAGSVVIDDSPQMLCGVVEDEFGTPIPYAGVELYEEFPSQNPPLMTMTAGANGEFCFDLNPPIAGKSNGVNSSLEGDDYVVRAYMAGYYPGTEGTEFPNTDITVVLAANAGEVTPTLEWVDLYCDEAYFDDMLLPLGTVIEAFDPDGVLCGQWTVTEEGRYGFMPVYTDDPWSSEDEGCDTNDVITLKVNGFEVEPFNAPLIWTGNGERIYTCFDGHSIIEVCMNLCAGWNLISWNVDTEFDDVDSIFQMIMPYIDVILGFEAEGLTYDPDLVEFSTLHESDHFHGFWVRVTTPVEFCVKGQFVDPMTAIPLEYNWNLVSYLPNDPMLTEDALVSVWNNLIVALGFDACGVGATSYDTEHPELATLDELMPNFGYWLKVDAAIDLVYPNLPIFFVSEPVDATYTKQGDIPVVAISNTWINLYGSGVTVDGEMLPNGTVIQAVNESDMLVGEFVVQDAGRFGFMPVYGADPYSGNGGAAGETIRLLVDGVEAQETVTWTNNGDRIKVDKFHLTSTAAGDDAVIPDQFELAQNFPNPFNPETAIEYTLGKAGHVELAIYNVLGTKIKTLVSDYQTKGTYTVKWYGDSDTGVKVASGVYLYKLSAEDFTETKKMMLLK